MDLLSHCSITIIAWLCSWNLFVPQSAYTWFLFCLESGPFCCYLGDTHPGRRLEHCPIESVPPKAGGRTSLGPSCHDVDVPNISPISHLCRCSIVTVQWFNFLRQNPLFILSTSSLQL